MDSIQTKSKQYVQAYWGKSVAQIAAIAEPTGFRIYVAWEWEKMAKQGVFGFTKSAKTFAEINSETINEAASFGSDISWSPEVKTIFKNLF